MLDKAKRFVMRSPALVVAVLGGLATAGIMVKAALVRKQEEAEVANPPELSATSTRPKRARPVARIMTLMKGVKGVGQ
jgi:hypothetical protein